MFPIKQKQEKQLKTLNVKRMIQKLPITLALVKAENTSEKLLNEIRPVMYSLYQAKEVTKNVCNNVMNSIKLNGCYIGILKIVKHLILPDKMK